ncbi:MAG: hypothetical protein RIQ62_649 [Bacteroidota bacterium]|jgi:hypothetical protein
MNHSSPQDITDAFSLLHQIKKADPNPDLYTKTLNRIHKKNIIPWLWVRAVACLLVIIFASEFYVVLRKRNTPSQNISVMIYKTNNYLYNE